MDFSFELRTHQYYLFFFQSVLLLLIDKNLAKITIQKKLITQIYLFSFSFLKKISIIIRQKIPIDINISATLNINQ